MKHLPKIIFQFLFISMVMIFPISNGLANSNISSPSIAAPSGTWQYWDDGSLDPAHRTLKGVDIVSATDGWAVGDHLIIHWNGIKWVKYYDPSSQTLNDVVMSSSTDGWAIGDDGDILHWNGSDWSLFNPIPDNYGLTKLSKVTPNDIWASGYWGKILHWNGSQWSSITSPVSHDLNSISMVSANDGWAVGYGGQMIHWNGTNWSTPIYPSNNWMYGVSMLSATSGWAVGNYKTMLHWNGISWSSVSGPFNDFNSLWMVKSVAENEAWAAGFDQGWNVLYHWNGTAWFVWQNNTDNVRYNSMGFVPGTNNVEAWIVGDATTILHKGGDPYIYNSPYSKNLFDVEMVTKNNGWAVGTLFPVYHGGGLLWNGLDWKNQTSMDGYALSFSPGSNGNDGWEVGVFGEIQHWNGIAWTKITSPTTIDLLDVDLLSPTDGWAVGGMHTNITQSVILRLQGTTWTIFTDPINEVLRAVDLINTKDGWAVGESGTMLHWNGMTWLPVTTGNNKNLNAISMISATDGFAVGQEGTILRWNGTIWNIVPTSTSADINAIQMLSDFAGWAVGHQQILYWNGNSWSVFPVQVYGDLKGISMVSYDEGWVVGLTGTIMHFTAPSANLSINYNLGQPGSFFTLTGINFPPDSVATIYINTHIMNTINVDDAGSFSFQLSTSGAQNGLYYVTASVNPTATTQFMLDSSAPLRSQQGAGTIITLPPNIAYTASVYLPLIKINN